MAVRARKEQDCPPPKSAPLHLDRSKNVQEPVYRHTADVKIAQRWRRAGPKMLQDSA